MESWDISLLPLEPGAMRADLAEVRFGQSALMDCSLSRSLQQLGGLPPGCRTIGIPLAGCSPFRWLGHEVDDEVLMIFPSGGELACRSQAGFRVMTLSVPDELIAASADMEGLGWVLKAGTHVVRPEPGVLQRLRFQAIGMMESARTSRDAMGDSGFRGEIEHDLLVAALEALASGRRATLRPMAAERSRVLSLAREIIESRVNESLLIGDLATLSRSSSRTLRYAFEEELGVSPKTYLKSRRLVELRRCLRRADPQSTVSEVAGDLGFWHLGQLALDYRAMFNELPSKTLGKSG